MTPADIEKAYSIVTASPEYEAILKLGMEDISTNRMKKNGTITFAGKVTQWGYLGYENDEYVYGLRAQRLKYSVLAHGKIDVTLPDDSNRYDIVTPKPTMVPGNPVQTVVRTMTKSLEKLKAVIERRKRPAEKEVKTNTVAAEREKADPSYTFKKNFEHLNSSDVQGFSDEDFENLGKRLARAGYGKTSVDYKILSLGLSSKISDLIHSAYTDEKKKIAAKAK